MEVVEDQAEGGYVISLPEPETLEEYSGQFKLRIPRSLHRSLEEHSKREGISMNQYCLYLIENNMKRCGLSSKAVWPG